MISLSPHAALNYGYEKLTGTPGAEFRFVPGVTPISTYREVGMICVTYLTVIFGGQILMKNRKPMQLSLLFQIHNAFLTVLSLGLFLVFFENAVSFLYNYGVVGSFCSGEAFPTSMDLPYYINYLTKYYELLDTCFLVARKKDLKFLHWYHHSMTALLCFVQLSGRTTASWVPVTLNLGVHVLMYYYYFLATFSIKVWWKKYITVMQITQFVIDLAVIYFSLYTGIAHRKFPHLPNMGDCHGDMKAGAFGAGILSTYLVLFVQFFSKAYSGSRQKSDAATPAQKPAAKKL